MPTGDPYYKPDLALVHHRGFGFHADLCAPGLLELLRPVLDRGGTVLELGCGSGLLTKKLVDAGHRVIATDASPAMLEIARDFIRDAEDVRQLILPDDSLPEADAIVSIGHVLSYLDDEAAIDRALVAIARATPPGGIFAIDICDLEWGDTRRDSATQGWVSDDWALITRFSMPTPARFVREMAIFVRNDDGSWRRSDERHDSVLIETALVPELLAPHGSEVEVRRSFGSEELPRGLHVLAGRRPS